MSVPAKLMRPPRTGFNPEMARSSAVLPAPLGPSTPTMALSATASETPFSTSMSVYPERRPSTDSIDCLIAEIGVDDRAIALNLGRVAFGDHAAVLHHRQGVSQRHHHPHVVLDHQERDVLRFGERAGGGNRVVRLGFAHAGRRLV